MRHYERLPREQNPRYGMDIADYVVTAVVIILFIIWLASNPILSEQLLSSLYSR